MSIIGDEIAVYDLAVDYQSGPLPEFRLSQDGEARYEGVLMGNGFVDDTNLHIAVDIKGKSKPKTFQTKDGKTLTYRRAVLASQPSNGTHNVGQRAEAIDSEAASQEAAKSTAKDGAGDEFQLVK